MITSKEIQFKTRFGQLAGLRWGEGLQKRIVAFHGWLDNAASFYHIAPYLVQAGYELTAVDFPGHGHSDHRAPGHNYGFIDYVIDVQAVMDLIAEPVILLGHSMGAAIAQLYAAAYPERVLQLLLIENMGPVPAYVPGSAAKSLRQALDVWQQHSLEHQRSYETIDDAIQARIQATPMDPVIIRPLVERGLRLTDEGYQWRTDKRLKLRSFFRMSEDQIQDFLRSLQVPCQLIVGEPRSYALDYDTFDDRLEALNPDQYNVLAGGHHLHMTHPQQVVDEVLTFLKAQPPVEKHSNEHTIKPDRRFHPF